MDHDTTLPDFNEPDSGPIDNEPDPGPSEPTHQLDDIQVEYHPHSQLPPSVHHFSEFSRSCPMEAYVPCNNSPWEPFSTRLDFEIAEIALEAAMTKEQTNRLLSLVHQSASGKDAFTLQNHDEVRSLWDLALQCYTRVSIVSCTTTNNIINLSLVHSFSVTMYLFPSKKRYMSLTCTTTLFGTGRLTCCEAH